jgi:hypothetical protein
VSTKVTIFGLPAAATLLCLVVWLIAVLLAAAICTAPLQLGDIMPAPPASTTLEGKKPHLRLQWHRLSEPRSGDRE